MDPLTSRESESRFWAYVEGLVGVIGHGVGVSLPGRICSRPRQTSRFPRIAAKPIRATATSRMMTRARTDSSWMRKPQEGYFRAKPPRQQPTETARPRQHPKLTNKTASQSLP